MAGENAEDLVRLGREALAATDWARARSCLQRARQQDETAEVLDLLGEAADFQGRLDR